jgi:hypothetical protein
MRITEETPEEFITGILQIAEQHCENLPDEILKLVDYNQAPKKT